MGDYGVAKADLELGLSGVRKALSTLRDYYGGAASMIQSSSDPTAFMQRVRQPTAPELHAKAGGAGGSIIDILEVVESDFATNLAKEEAEEADAQSEYERVSQENAATRTLKNQDVKYRRLEAKSQDATVPSIPQTVKLRVLSSLRFLITTARSRIAALQNQRLTRSGRGGTRQKSPASKRHCPSLRTRLHSFSGRAMVPSVERSRSDDAQ